MDRRSLVGHSLWGRKRVRHNIVTKHKPPIDYNTDRAFLCCLLSLLFRYSKVAVDESSVFLKPPNGSALLAGHLIFASFPGASSCIVCKGFFCVWKLAWEVLRAWPCSDVSSWVIYSQTAAILRSQSSQPHYSLSLPLGVGLFSAQSLNTSTEVVWPEPGWTRMPCSGFSIPGRSLCGQIVLAVSQLWTHMQNPR